MARSGESKFHERFGYARWIRHLVTGEAPSFAMIAKALPGEKGEPMTGQAVSGWKRRTEPPTNWKLHAPLAAALGVDEDWLIKDEGEPPHSALWAAWLEARAHPAPRRAPIDQATIEGERLAKVAGKKAATATRRVVGSGRPGKRPGGR